MVEADEAQHFLHRGVDFRLRLSGNAQAKRNILRHRHIREKRIGLKHHADIALVGLEVHHILAVDFYGAAVGHLETGDHAQNSRLAAARRAEEGDEFALFHGKVEIVDDGIGAEALFQVFDIQKSHESYPAVVLNLLRRETSCSMMMLSHVMPNEMIASADGS